MDFQPTVLGAQHPLLVKVRKAARSGSATPDGEVLAEGWNLLEEALRSHISIASIISTEAKMPEVWEKYKRYANPLHLTTRFYLTNTVNLAKISQSETPQPVLALVNLPVWRTADFVAGRPVLVLDRIQDPGNAGALVRSAEAFGAGGVVFLTGSATPMHPKTLRASAGSLFRVPFVFGGVWQQVASGLPRPTYGLMAGAKLGADAADLGGACTLVVGNEGGGLAAEIVRSVVPLSVATDSVESLNAGVAAAICLYEAARQRRQS